MTPEFLEAVLDGDRERASETLDVRLPDDFPGEGIMRFLALRLSQMRRDERFLQWCPHAVVLDGQMIGHAGYHGPPGVNANQSPTRSRSATRSKSPGAVMGMRRRPRPSCCDEQRSAASPLRRLGDA